MTDMTPARLAELKAVAEAATEGAWYRDERILARFWSKVEKKPYCWEWRGYASPYGSFLVRRKNLKAHRAAWSIAHTEEVPTGLVIDHICRNTRCVRPDHLRAVTQRENLLSGRTITAEQLSRDTCRNGHRLEGENLFTKSDESRGCRSCERNWNKDARKKHYEKARSTCPKCGVSTVTPKRHWAEVHEGKKRKR